MPIQELSCDEINGCNFIDVWILLRQNSESRPEAALPKNPARLSLAWLVHVDRQAAVESRIGADDIVEFDILSSQFLGQSAVVLDG